MEDYDKNKESLWKSLKSLNIRMSVVCDISQLNNKIIPGNCYKWV